MARETNADVLVSGDRDLLEMAQLEVEVIPPRQFVDRLATSDT